MLGSRISALRRSLGLSQADLARRLRISPSAMGMYEQGRREPSLEVLVELAEVLGVSTDYLLTGHLATEQDSHQWKKTLQSAMDRAQVRQLQRPDGLSREELAVLLASILLES